ncbi:SLAP domain-containing protein [Lactobacillus crispatus]|uniref:SLAP domain-containing protein n=1 Tax=Lactobacillus crispatus TaxID=47770 RepID=UPI0025A3A73D|nr:SLAP domain-containing protein [Lactobacillus crispatus]MDM8290067.1 SLAP domain-containing protein [Lactobacillus crispatus]
MKKNLRIVSAAAAALLAVAPVAASAVSTVSADAVTTATSVNTPITLPDSNAKVNITPNVSLTTSDANVSVDTALSASFTATVDGTTATSTFSVDAKDPSSVKMWAADGKGSNPNNPIKSLKDITAANAGTLYKVQLNNVSLNFGDKNGNKDVTLVLPNENGNHFDNNKNTIKVHLDRNGVAKLGYVVFGVYAKDFSNSMVVQWHSANTGAVVNSASFQLYAGSDAGKMNVDQVMNQLGIGTKKANGYYASQDGTVDSQIKYTDNLEDALKAAGVDVDAQGWFVAPKSFTFNVTAKSEKNDATATLPVTVNVPNGKDTTVPSQSKTVMHNAYFYDKNGKRVGSDKVTRYNSVNVAMSTTKIGDKTYYEVVENGKATGKFINADNIDGTKRTLKHNAYVYKSSKKRANKVVLKKGEEVTTYGGTYTFKNGKQYYKIGNDTKKTYVKASNF